MSPSFIFILLFDVEIINKETFMTCPTVEVGIAMGSERSSFKQLAGSQQESLSPVGDSEPRSAVASLQRFFQNLAYVAVGEREKRGEK